MSFEDEVVLEPESTPLGRFQKERTDALSEMFETGPDGYGIYQTTKLFVRLDKAFQQILARREDEIRRQEAGLWFAHHIDRKWMLERANELEISANHIDTDDDELSQTSAPPTEGTETPVPDAS